MENFSDQKVSNLDYLTELSKGNKKFIADMVGIFLEENPGEIALLEESIRNKNFDSIKAYAHKLKSSIPFVGINKIIDKDIAEMEDLAVKRTDLEKIQLLFDTVKIVCEKARMELHEFQAT